MVRRRSWIPSTQGAADQSYHAMPYHTMPYHHITSHHITSHPSIHTYIHYRVIPYYTIPYNTITLHCITYTHTHTSTKQDLSATLKHSPAKMSCLCRNAKAPRVNTAAATPVCAWRYTSNCLKQESIPAKVCSLLSKCLCVRVCLPTGCMHTRRPNASCMK